MRKNLLLFVLFLLSSFISKAQEGSVICGTTFEDIVPSPTVFGPKTVSSFTGSVDPDYLASFEPISFNIYFWIINPEGNNVNFYTRNL